MKTLKVARVRASSPPARRGARPSARPKPTAKVGGSTRSPARPAAKSRPRESTARSNPRFWQLRLYVLDSTARSNQALANLKQVCETHLKGRYGITVIDLLKQPHLAQGDQILAIPTVVRRLPHPVRILIGNLSNTERIVVGLDLRAAL